MKKIITFNDFVSESIRDKMTPKSKEDMESSLNKIPSVKDRLSLAGRLGIKYDIMNNSYTVSPNELLRISSEQHLLDGVKEAVERGSHKSYALRLCSEYGFYDGVEWLLKNGANPYSNDSEAFKISKNNPSISRLIGQYRKNTVPYNESVRDMMTPKSKEDIKNSLIGLNPEDIIRKIVSLKILDYYTKEEIREILDKLDDRKKVEVVLKNKLLDYYTRPELRDMLDKMGSDFSIILQNDKFFSLLSVEKFRELKEYVIGLLMDRIGLVTFHKDINSGRYEISRESYRVRDRLIRYGNGIYVVLDNYDFAEFKLYITKKNVAFAEISSTEYKIWSEDKIRIVLDKLVDDVLNGRKVKFTVLKFDGLMR